MHNSIKKPVFYSLCVHVMVAFLGWRLFFGVERPVQETKGKESQFLNVTIGKNSYQSSEVRLKNQAKSSKSKKNAPLKKKNLNDLNLSLVPFDIQSSNRPSPSQEPEQGFEFSNNMGLRRETELYAFFKALWQRIDRSIEYPDDFVKSRNEGIVNAEFMVNRQGIFANERLVTHSGDRILESYVIVALIHGLKEPLQKKFWADQDQIPITIQVHFKMKMLGSGETPNFRKGSHFRNLLTFYRFSQAKPKLNEFVEKALERYIPPVIILPGFVYVDFYRLHQFISNIHKPDPDDQRKVRMELMGEQLREIRNLNHTH